MLTEVTPTYWVIKVHGVAICPNQPTKSLAESLMLTLPPEQRSVAELVAVTPDGRSILLG